MSRDALQQLDEEDFEFDDEEDFDGDDYVDAVEVDLSSYDRPSQHLSHRRSSHDHSDVIPPSGSSDPSPLRSGPTRSRPTDASPTRAPRRIRQRRRRKKRRPKKTPHQKLVEKAAIQMADLLDMCEAYQGAFLSVLDTDNEITIGQYRKQICDSMAHIKREIAFRIKDVEHDARQLCFRADPTIPSVTRRVLEEQIDRVEEDSIIVERERNRALQDLETVRAERARDRKRFLAAKRALQSGKDLHIGPGFFRRGGIGSRTVTTRRGRSNRQRAASAQQFRSERLQRLLDHTLRQRMSPLGNKKTFGLPPTHPSEAKGLEWFYLREEEKRRLEKKKTRKRGRRRRRRNRKGNRLNISEDMLTRKKTKKRSVTPTTPTTTTTTSGFVPPVENMNAEQRDIWEEMRRMQREYKEIERYQSSSSNEPKMTTSFDLVDVEEEEEEGREEEGEGELFHHSGTDTHHSVRMSGMVVSVPSNVIPSSPLLLVSPPLQLPSDICNDVVDAMSDHHHQRKSEPQPIDTDAMAAVHKRLVAEVEEQTQEAMRIEQEAAKAREEERRVRLEQMLTEVRSLKGVGESNGEVVEVEVRGAGGGEDDEGEGVVLNRWVEEAGPEVKDEIARRVREKMMRVFEEGQSQEVDRVSEE